MIDTLTAATSAERFALDDPRDARLIEAACRSVDPEIMFPIGREGSPGFERGVDRARVVCASCPLLSPCLRYALTSGNHAEDGIVAGTTPEQRRLLRAQQGLVTLRRVPAPVRRLRAAKPQPATAPAPVASAA